MYFLKIQIELCCLFKVHTLYFRQSNFHYHSYTINVKDGGDQGSVLVDWTSRI